MSTVTVTLPTNTVPIATPLLLGFLFNWGLFGVLTVQVYFYYMAFPGDRTFTKRLVYALYLVEVVQTGLVTHDAFNYYAKGYGNLNALGNIQWEWIGVPIFSGIVSCTVQLYYGFRLSVLSGSRVLGGVVAVLAVTEGIAAIVQGVQALIIGNYEELASKAFVSCTIWLLGSALCDLVIAVAMTVVLMNKDTQNAHTRSVINKIIRVVIETGCLTAVTATLDIVLFLAFRDKPYHGCAALTLGKLYSNSLLAVFNSRIQIVGGREVSTSAGNSFVFGSHSVSTRGGASGGPFGRSGGDSVSVTLGGRSTIGGGHTASKQLESIQVRKEQETWTDGDIIPLEYQVQRSYGDVKRPSNHSENSSMA